MGVLLLICRLSTEHSTPQGEQWTVARLVMTWLECCLQLSLYSEQPTQNWSGQGESDCLIKTKHCDGPKGC